MVAVVEKGGTHALGVETQTRGRANMGLLSGDFGLVRPDRSTTLAGFEAEYFLVDDRDRLSQVEMGSLLGRSRRRSRSVLVSGVTLVLERNANGTNYGVLLDNLEQLSGSEGDQPTGDDQQGGDPGGEQGESEPGPELVIGEIVLRDIESEITVLVIDDERRTIPIALPEITIYNVGGEDGASVDVVYSKLIEELLAAVIAAGGDQLPAELLKDLEGGLKQLGEDQLRQQEDRLREKAVEQLGADGVDALENAAKGVNDLFKKD